MVPELQIKVRDAESIGNGGAPPLPAAPVPVVRIARCPSWRPLALREFWEYRELLYFLAWRDLSVRYKQTALGVAWAVIQPLLAMVVFTVFFGRLARVPSGGIPYPIFSYAALVPWTFFANGLNQVSNSVVRDSSLISKVYFPRLVVPIASVLAGLVDFTLAFIVLLGMMAAYGFVPTANALWIPLLVLLALGAALGVGLWLSSWSVRYRDVRYVVPFVVQMWLFATPVVYPASMVPARWQLVYALNPMAGVVEGFRWALLGTGTAPGPIILVSALMVVLLLAGGAFYYRRQERTFADII